jgi:3-phosphoshikimate 1-carboxyvinyltransferase
MSTKIIPQRLSGHVHMIGSKSYAHRALIAASLSQGVSHIKNYPISDDVFATIHALYAFGIEVNDETVYGKPWRYNKKPVDCLASGSTLRFLIPLSTQLNEEITFTGVKRLFERPLDVYEKIFQSHEFNVFDSTLTVKGQLNQKHYVIDGSKSSQFLSGLLFALPLETHDTTLEISPAIQSESYVDMTLDVLKKASIHIEKKDHMYVIKGNQTYQAFDYEVEGDYSQAAFFMVAATIGSTITISNLLKDSRQGDFKIVDIIENMGGDISYDENNSLYHIRPAQTHGIEIDLKDIPDLGPILMVLASLSKGDTYFTHINRLRYKESDRLEVMLDILKKLGVSYVLNDDSLKITGRNTLKGGQHFQTHGDHRIAMSLAVLSIRVDEPITIDDISVVSKSYPNFFEVFQSLGGIYESVRSY